MPLMQQYWHQKLVEMPGASLNFWTLRFVEDGMEYGFLQSRTKNVLSSMSRCAFLVSIGTFGVLAAYFVIDDNSQVFTGGQDDVPRYGSNGLLFCVFAIACSTIVWAKVPRLHRRFGPFSREILGCLLALFGLTFFSCADYYYMAKILGYNPWTMHPLPRGDYTLFSDSKVLLSIEGAVTLSHFLTPIRWCILSAVPVAGVLLYLVFILFFGSPETMVGAITNWMVLTVTVLGMSLGKRSFEWHERFQFVTVIEERKLRCDVEFKLETLHGDDPLSTKRPRSSSAGTSEVTESIAETTPTGKIFESLQVEMPAALQEIASLGRREHWLIDAEDVNLFTETILGFGGFGVVVAGRFEGMPVAVKTSRHGDSNQSLTRDLANELRVLRQVRHPNIVMLHGACVGIDESDIALILEYVDGLTLGKFIGDSPPLEHLHPLAHRYQIMLGLCSALRYLHSRTPSIVHGDLKASNIIIEAGPRSKILDFGLSRLVTAHAKNLGGTYQWCAPEVILKTCKAPSCQADVFSLGWLVCFIARGDHPLTGLDRRVIQKLAKAGHLVPPRKLVKDPLAEHCAPLAELCLSMDPLSRPTARHVFEVMSSWPKDLCFEPVSKCFSEIDAQHATANSASSCSMDLHSQLAKVRESVPSPKSKPWWHVKKPERESLSPGRQSIGKNHRKKGNSGKKASQLPVLPEVLGKVLAENSSYSFRSGVMTPRPMLSLMMLEMVQRWNFKLDELPCCKYHAALNLAADIVRQLQTSICCFNFPPETSMVQCPSCHVFDDKPAQGEEFMCSVCGCLQFPDSDRTTARSEEAGSASVNSSKETMSLEERMLSDQEMRAPAPALSL